LENFFKIIGSNRFIGLNEDINEKGPALEAFYEEGFTIIAHFRRNSK
jgi:hypothetical protein